MKRPTVLLACLVAATALTPLAVAAQDMATTAKDHVKVLLDNDKVRVLELQMPPGASTGMHSHGDNIVYFESGGEVTQTKPDGTSAVATRKPGEVVWSDPVTHDSKNTGKKPVKTLVIELKAPATTPP